MIYFFAGGVIALCVWALRDEFRNGGSLHVDRLAPPLPAAPAEFDGDGIYMVVSSRGVEIPVGLLSVVEIVEVLTDIDQVDAFEATA